MNKTELQRLLVVIEGSIAPYKKALKEALSETKKSTQDIGKELGKAKGMNLNNDSFMKDIKNTQRLIRQSMADMKSGVLPKAVVGNMKEYVQQAQIAAGIKVPTEEYVNLEREIEKAEKRAKELRLESEMLEKRGDSKGLSEKYFKIQTSAKSAQKELEKLLKSKEQLEKDGKDVDFSYKYQSLYDQAEAARKSIADLEKQKQVLEKKGITKDNRRILNEDGSLVNVDEEIKKTEGKLKSLLKNMKSLEDKGKMFQPSEAMRKLTEKIEAANDKISKYKNNLSTLSAGGMKYGTEEWIRNQKEIDKTIQKIGMLKKEKQSMNSSGQAYTYPKTSMSSGSRLQTAGAVASKMKSGATAKLKEIQTQITATIKRIPVIGKAATEASYIASKAFGGMKTVLQKAGPAITKAGGAAASMIKKFANGIPVMNKFRRSMQNTGKSGRNLGGMLGTLAMTAKFMFASFVIGGALRGAKEGFQNLARYSGQTNASLSMLMSSLTQLKNSLATAFAPILNVIAPILNAFIQKISQAVTAIGMLFASLTGQTVFTGAKKVHQDYAASLDKNATGADKADKANKKLQKTLLGFDQLHKMDDNSSSSDTGGGSGAGGLTPSDMFMDVPINSKISEFANKLKEAWRNADFTEIGQIVGNKVNAALQNIPWENIQNTLSRIAKSAATFLNGFLETVDWVNVGNTISRGINTAFMTANTFAETFHWDSFGRAVGNGLNGAINGLDWPLIKGTVHNIASGVIENLNTFFQTADWKKVGSTVAEFFNTVLETLYTVVSEFDWKGFGSSVGNAVNGALRNFDWKKAGQALSKGITGILDAMLEAINTIDWKQIGRSIGAFLQSIDWTNIVAKALQVLASLPFVLYDMISGFLEEVDWGQLVKDVAAGIQKFFEEFDWAGSLKSTGELIGAAFKALFEVGEVIGEAISDSITKAKEYFQEKMEECGGSIVLGILKGIKDAILGIGEWIKENIFQPFIDGFKEAFGIHSPSTVMAEQGKYIVEGLRNGLVNNIKSVIDWAKKLPGDIKKALGNAKEWLVEKGEDAVKGLQSGWEAVKNSKFGQMVSKTGNFVKEKAGDAKNWIKQKGQDAIEGLQSGWERAKNSTLLSNVSRIGGEIVGKIGNVFEKTKPKGNEVVRGMQQGITGNMGTLTSVSKSIPGKIVSSIGNMTPKMLTIGKSVSDGLKNGIQNSLPSIMQAAQKIPSQISKSMGSLYNIGHSAISGLAQGFRSVHIPMPHFSVSSSRYWIGSKSFSVPKINLQWYAAGGFPENGEMFVAREAGPELVGRMGRKNAVANNNQIVEGIKAGVFEAVMDAFEASSFKTSQGGQNVTLEFTLLCDSETIYKMSKRGEQKYGDRFTVIETV